RCRRLVAAGCGQVTAPPAEGPAHHARRRGRHQGAAAPQPGDEPAGSAGPPAFTGGKCRAYSENAPADKAHALGEKETAGRKNPARPDQAAAREGKPRGLVAFARVEFALQARDLPP